MNCWMKSHNLMCIQTTRSWTIGYLFWYWFLWAHSEKHVHLARKRLTPSPNQPTNQATKARIMKFMTLTYWRAVLLSRIGLFHRVKFCWLRPREFFKMVFFGVVLWNAWVLLCWTWVSQHWSKPNLNLITFCVAGRWSKLWSVKICIEQSWPWQQRVILSSI